MIIEVLKMEGMLYLRPSTQKLITILHQIRLQKMRRFRQRNTRVLHYRMCCCSYRTDEEVHLEQERCSIMEFQPKVKIFFKSICLFLLQILHCKKVSYFKIYVTFVYLGKNILFKEKISFLLIANLLDFTSNILDIVLFL